ncbi:MAG: hypothetical protein D6709_10155 [Chloroflexi bacterium]|jgi:hypothetical protein|uniref:DUF4175 domain-containing protein n=2 Tax=Candidatus Thermofonsia Clade 3 TaxID=2364209 RepID=A0A2M8QG76_9CHLR|nr:MAG: hypothetical protein CUN48_02055 [Candidatus Thermofonsia Clade 3 bacterium]RMG62930.1 MAG: hypothetical protein D6709_10155 [Chloroflexota bacterium]
MKTMNELTEIIRAWSRRARLQHSIRLAFFGLACGLGVALLIALASRVFPLMSTATLIGLSIALAIAGLVGALAYPWLRHARTSPMQWARVFDQRFGLQERTSTALEIGEGHLSARNDLIRNIQRQDAERVTESVDARKLMPLHISRRDAILSLLFLMALVLAILLPNPQQQVLAQREQLRQTIAQQIERLGQAQQMIENSALSDAQKQAALQALDEARRKLEDPNVTPEEALAALNEAQSQLDALNDQAAQQQAEDLRRAGESLAPDALTNALANALANEHFDRAANEMRRLTDSSETGQPLSEEEMQRAADQLDQLARSVQNSDPELAQRLREAAQNMREGNIQAAQQQLDQAAQSLERAQETREASQALDRAQSQAEAARQAIAQQASQSQSQRPGQSQAGSNTPAGAQGRQSSQSQAQTSGRGEADNASARDSTTASDERSGASSSRKSDDFGSDDTVYAPRRISGEGRPVVLPEAQNPTAPNPDGRTSTAPGGGSSVPYEQVYGDYSKAADEALRSGRVPPDMRDYVRDYFSSLDPNPGNR